MPILPREKVGLISCSGEELPEGTISRMAALRVLEQLRPHETVTLCLPLFLAGDDKERAFARFYPTIAIDGCDKRCAARATEKYSARPRVSVVIPEVLAARRLTLMPRSRRQSDQVNASATEAVADVIALRVDEILGATRGAGGGMQKTVEGEAVSATCSCGSGVPVMRLTIAGQSVQVVALPLLFEQFHNEHKSPDGLLDAVKIYNAVPADLEPAYREAVLRAYADYVSRERGAR